MRIADLLMSQTVDLEPRLAGTTPTGPAFGPVRTVRAAVDDTQVISGEELVSSTVVYVDLENFVPSGSKVTIWKGLPQQRTAIVHQATTSKNAFLGHVMLKLE